MLPMAGSPWMQKAPSRSLWRRPIFSDEYDDVINIHNDFPCTYLE